MKRLITSFLIFLIGALMLAACTQSQPAAPSQAESGGGSEQRMGVASLRMLGPAPGPEYDLDLELLADFTAETGIQVELIPGPQSATNRLSEYLITLGQESSDVDVYQIDVIWPGILANHMVDLKQYLGDEANQHFQAIVANNTVGGRLVGMPWYTDAGLLYYRTDLLEKYGYSGPPQTWDELEEMAAAIQAGEQGEGNSEFWGYVWQGAAYEGLTCDALEWQVSHGGGKIIEADGTISVNNAQAAAAFERAAGWVGTISPPQVTQYLEEDSRLVWHAGNAAFMRNWPYAYALSQGEDSAVKDKFDVTLLPDGGGGNAATLGGWQLAVSRYSNNPQAAARLVSYLTSPEVQRRRAVEASFAPTIPDLYDDADVLAANPYYDSLKDVFAGGAVARPSGVSGEAYAEVSFDYFTAVHNVLTGDQTAAQALADLEDGLTALAELDESVGPVTLRFVGAPHGVQIELDRKLLDQFTAETGIQVELIPGPESATDRLSEYLITLGQGSSDVDVYQIDVIWPGILADHMVDLKQYLGDEANQHFQAIVANNTVGGKLVGMPWYTDAGLLYYRTDLLEKYGYSGPPQTWDELEEMAAAIQAGERDAGNNEFWGYVWQGAPYEGLTCDALEWQVSHGGGKIIEADGTISVNNAQAAAAFERAAGWVGTISPSQVTQYQEEDSRGVWHAGNAAFMRNWPYAYSLSQGDDSAVKDKFDVTLLPDGGGGHAATLGGWQLAVSRYSNNPQAAARLVSYLTSPEIQLQRSIEGSFAPTIADLYDNSDALAANPYYLTLKDVFAGGAVARPSGVSGEAYAEVSFDYFTAVHNVLTGDQTAAQALADLEDGLTALAELDESVGPVTLRFVGPPDDVRLAVDRELVADFIAETGINVELVPGPESTTDRLGEALAILSRASGEYDVYMIDVIWPGILADHMVDLNQYLGDEANQHFQAIVANNTVGGKLVGMPWYTDAGLLYYRTDLLEKYGYSGPPQTWDELEEMAAAIQAGEQGEGNNGFWGYVWQGAPYEGLTCDALEWQVSHGGGKIIEADGTISVNNAQTVAALERAAGWVGTISPPQVTQYLEEDSRGVWQAGNAAFMRNWPYAYAPGQAEDSLIRNKFDVTLLPDGGGGHAATLGGWQLAVSSYSNHPQEAAAFVSYMTSPEAQLRRAVGGSYAPTIAEVYNDPVALEANPYYASLQDLFPDGAVARPSSQAGEAYAELSFVYFTAVHDVLTGNLSAAEAVADLEAELIDIASYETTSP
jgi:trehalose/maltose transport system substrate-binding protein